MTNEKNVWFDEDTLDEIQFKVSKITERKSGLDEMRSALVEWVQKRFPGDECRAAIAAGEMMARALLAKGMAEHMVGMLSKIKSNTHKIEVGDEADVVAFLSDLKLLVTEYGGDPDSVSDGMLAMSFDNPENKTAFEEKLELLKVKHGLGGVNESGMPYLGPRTEA
jgi:hypothetical protein